MKKIIIATDFSKISDNAINYGVEIAKLKNCQIVLMHILSVPIITSEAQMYIPPLDEMKKDCESLLEQAKKKIILKNGNVLEIECVCIIGFAVEEINRYAKDNKVDLIVIGMHGADYLTEKVIGSTTTSLISEAKCPVLAIDEKVKFKSLKKVVLAFDYIETTNRSILNPLKEFVHLFNSHVYILHVINDLNKAPTISEAVTGIKLERTLSDISHSYHYIRNEDVVDGINDFVAIQKMDMVVMIPRKHSFFKNVFNESKTKRTAFHSKVPLLTIHE
jgi:nucleotide-binding universal stress UspA family protein